MIRFVKKDFDRFQLYIENYAMLSDLGSKAREDLLKRAHKHSLAALQIWAVFEEITASGSFTLYGKSVLHAAPYSMQIGECFSDILSALLSGVHGLYKPAHVCLRSAIETFVRGFAGISSPEAGSTTSVFKLFDLAALEPQFQGTAEIHLRILHENYGELCLFTHSSTPAHMARNYALANFPRQDTVQLKSVVRHLESVVISTLSILILAEKRLYLLVPPVAREVIDEILPKQVKLHAMGNKE